MISSETIRAKIVERAQKQYLRDIAQIKKLLSERGKPLTITDAIKLSKEADEKELKQLKKSWFNFNKQKIDAVSDEGDAYSFILKLMATIQVDELTLEDFESLPLSKIYFENFKIEYENYQQFLFDTKDAQFYSGNYPVIRGKMHPEANAEGEVENY